MGGSSSSSSTSSQTTNNVDKRLVVDSGVGVSADNSVVNLTTNTLDGGAIANAFQFSGNALYNALGVSQSATNNAMGFAGNSLKNALDFSSETIDKTLENNSDVMRMSNDTIKLANANTSEGFSKLLDASESLFDRGERMIGKTQQTVADAYTLAQTTKAGTIDNKTIIVLAIAGAATVYAISRKG